MVENNISIFGAPYYPSYIFKPRYFPCVICMFIDLEKVHINDLDFTPEFYEHILVKEFSNEDLLRFILGLPTPHTDQANKFKRATLIEVALNNLRNRYIYSIPSKIFPNFAKQNLSISRDTGYKIFSQYHRSKYFKNECLTPAFTNPLYDESVKKQSLFEKALYHFIPDALSQYPLHRNYTVNRFFRDFNLPDINRLGWEEYFWQNSPFGFHVKGSSSKDNFGEDLKMGQLLGQF